MSDGCTEASRQSQAFSRRQDYISKILDYLENQQTDPSSVPPLYQAGYPPLIPNPERSAPATAAQVTRFIQQLRAGDRQTWAELLSFARPETSERNFKALIALSPFKENQLLFEYRDGKMRVRIARTITIEVFDVPKY